MLLAVGITEFQKTIFLDTRTELTRDGKLDTRYIYNVYHKVSEHAFHITEEFIRVGD